MANTVTTRVLIDGPKEAYVYVYLLSDGASGELVNQVIIDPATLVKPPEAQTAASVRLAIMEVWYENVGFDTILKFNASTPAPAWKLAAASSSNHVCLDKFGGIKDSLASGNDGKIVISTAGFTTTTDEGTFVVRVRKD